MKKNSVMLRVDWEFEESLRRMKRMINAMNIGAREFSTVQLTREILKDQRFREIQRDLIQKNNKKRGRSNLLDDLNGNEIL